MRLTVFVAPWPPPARSPGAIPARGPLPSHDALVSSRLIGETRAKTRAENRAAGQARNASAVRNRWRHANVNRSGGGAVGQLPTAAGESRARAAPASRRRHPRNMATCWTCGVYVTARRPIDGRARCNRDRGRAESRGGDSRGREEPGGAMIRA